MAAWIGACGPSPGTLRGHSPGPTALVGHVTLPEVAPGEAAHPFPLRAPKGKLLYVYFGYTSCPDICPATLSDFRRALSLLGNDSMSMFNLAAPGSLDARTELEFHAVDRIGSDVRILARLLPKQPTH